VVLVLGSRASFIFSSRINNDEPTQQQRRVDDGYGSEAGAPDDADQPEDDALEFEKWRVCT